MKGKKPYPFRGSQGVVVYFYFPTFHLKPEGLPLPDVQSLFPLSQFLLLFFSIPILPCVCRAMTSPVDIRMARLNEKSLKAAKEKEKKHALKVFRSKPWSLLPT